MVVVPALSVHVDTVIIHRHVISVNIAAQTTSREDDLHAQPCENSYSGSRDKRSHGGGGIQPQPAQATQPNIFLEGVHTPLTEEITEIDPKVTGAIPAGLDGLYVRNGPNPVSPVNPAAHHWFVGDGMLHGVRLQDGKALWYRNRCGKGL